MRELLKKLLVPLLASRQVTAIAERLFGNGIPIFVLHRLTQEGTTVAGKTSPDHLRKCLDYLKDHDYNFISLEHLILALQGKEVPYVPWSCGFTVEAKEKLQIKLIKKCLIG